MNATQPGLSTLLQVAAIGVSAAAMLGSSCGEEPWTWELEWQDEFEGNVGDLPDPSRWSFDVGTDWGNDQLEYDTDRAENVSVDGSGNLAITARRESFEGQPYTSGRITTQNKFAKERGRFEARIKLPIGRGIWPAFWLLGDNFSQVGWPQCGEIDILEYRGQESNVILGSVHGPGYSGGGAVTGRYTLPSGSFDGDFHLYGIEWDSERISWTVDDVRYHTVSASDLAARGGWVFNHPFFIILNVAVGGNFVGAPDASTVFPQTMLVDYIRVYRGQP